jgi:hypothetical protein
MQLAQRPTATDQRHTRLPSKPPPLTPSFPAAGNMAEGKEHLSIVICGECACFGDQQLRVRVDS